MCSLIGHSSFSASSSLQYSKLFVGIVSKHLRILHYCRFPPGSLFWEKGQLNQWQTKKTQDSKNEGAD